MKTLHAPTSPGPELRFASWRIESAGEEPPPHLTFENLPPLDMSMDGNKRSSISSPTLLNNRDSSSPSHRSASSSIPLSDATSRLNTPTRIPRRQNSMSRRTLSANHELSTTGSAQSRATSEAPSEGGGGDTSPWSGAVGKASLGKSGRVIERLMAERDQLKRELNAQIQHRQEIEKREDLNKQTIDGLKTENSNLLQAAEIDAAAIKRRERKIEELRNDVEAERAKRVTAEQMAQQACANRDEVIATTNRELSEARELAKHATSHADVLEQSHKQLGTEYRQRTETFTNDLQRLAEDRDDERKKVKRLDVVVEQLKQEVDRTNKITEKMNETFAAYKNGAEVRIDELKTAARKHEDADAALREETERVVGEARHLLNLTKNARERDERLRISGETKTAGS